MSLIPKSKSHSPRSAVVMLVVGVLAGLTVGGGVGVIAASSTKVTVCANKKTDMLRYAKSGRCETTETKVELNQTGPAGARGLQGVAGARGVAGPRGATGADGASSPTGFTARSVCGASGTALCAVGVQGPGGGTIVYVDSTNEMPMYDYLEVAPEDASTGVAWSTTTTHCGTTATTDCQLAFLSDASTALDYIGLGTGRPATAAIVARHNAGGVAKADYAAGVADAYTTVTASDWFLPSKDELNEVCKYARNTGQDAGADIVCAGGVLRNGFSNEIEYWSSTEFIAVNAWIQAFYEGSQYKDVKRITGYYVRPVRAF